MNKQKDSAIFTPALKKLVAAITAQAFCASVAFAAPMGGIVTGGDGAITQSGAQTRIDQNTQRLSIDWDSFNVSAGERVQFVQPSADATALNRILDHNPSSIMGRIDANGRIILMNPNGVIFGAGSSVNVQSLVASGLNIDTDDFMNGDLIFSGIAGTSGHVVNSGIINAATGGNVALLGKTVVNNNLINANLGHIALASGNRAVVSFDEQGMLGVRIDEKTLASELGDAAGVTNQGRLTAKSGRILLNASVSEDLFSAAVNHGHLNGNVEAVVHSDGSFTIGAGNKVVNKAHINVSSDAGSAHDAGQVILAGGKVSNNSSILADASADNLAGNISVEGEEIVLGPNSRMIAINNNLISGRVSLTGDTIESKGAAVINTSGNTIINAYDKAQLPRILTHHGYLAGLDRVSQNRAYTATGNVHVRGLAGADIKLSNAGNDFKSVSVEGDYYGMLDIVDSNDIQLGDIALQDFSVSVRSVGDNATISQVADSSIQVFDSDLALAADNILLGGNGGTTTATGASLAFDFNREINTNGSINVLNDEWSFDSATVTGWDEGTQVIQVNSDGAIDAAIQLIGDEWVEEINIDRIVGSNATFSGYNHVRQTGPITLTDTLTWNNYEAVLTHAENDIARLEGNGSVAFGYLNYTDRNDVVLGNLDVTSENMLTVTALGDGEIRQAPHTLLKVNFVTLDGANVDLGANGTSSINAYYSLEINFRDTLHMNGPYSIGNYAPSLVIRGDAGDNTFIYGEHAHTDSFSNTYGFDTIDIDLGAGHDTAWFYGGLIHDNTHPSDTISLNMGSGDDKVYLYNHVTVPITLGSGFDYVQEYEHGTIFELVDFDSTEDTYHIVNP